MANYLVIGLGRFGQSVASTLYKNNQTVLVIDEKEELVQHSIDNQIADDGIILDVTDENSLRKVVNDNFETAFVCIGTDIQSSILVTLLLKEMGVKNIICKARTKIQGKVLERVGATEVVYPEETMGEETAIKALQPNITEYFKFSEKYGIFEFEAPKSFDGKNLIELDFRNNYEMNIIGIKTDKNEPNVNPTPQTIISEGNILLVVANLEKIENLSKLLSK